MLKKIYQELVAIRKELQAVQSDLEHIRKHPFNVVTGIPLPRSPKYGTDEADQGRPDFRKKYPKSSFYENEAFYKKEIREKIVRNMNAPENQLRSMTESTGLRIVDALYTLLDLLLVENQYGANHEK